MLFPLIRRWERCESPDLSWRYNFFPVASPVSDLNSILHVDAVIAHRQLTADLTGKRHCRDDISDEHTLLAFGVQYHSRALLTLLDLPCNLGLCEILLKLVPKGYSRLTLYAYDVVSTPGEARHRDLAIADGGLAYTAHVMT